MKARLIMVTRTFNWKLTRRQFLHAIAPALWMAGFGHLAFVYAIAAAEKTKPEEPFVFRSREEAENALKQRELQSQTNILKRMKAAGASWEEISGIREGFILKNAGVFIRTWDDWTNYYRPEILNPPIQFDARPRQPKDFSSLVAAFRAFEHAVFIGDAKTLLANADESGRAWLRRYMRVDENVPRPTYEMFPAMSVFTVLLTAAHTFDDKDYALVLSRCQEYTNPRSGRVSFLVHIFRRDASRYVFTSDLSIYGPFGSVRTIARASEGNLQPYPQFFEKMKNSAFPPHFYTIETGN